MRQALLYAGDCDMLVHVGDGLGDGLSVAEEFGLAFHGVSGNEDHAHRAEHADEKRITVASLALLLAHGHQMDVNPYHSEAQWRRHVGKMAAWAKRRKADVFLFGHSHRALLTQKEGIIICNPGDMCYGSAVPPGFVLIRVDGATATVRLMRLNRTGDWDIVQELRKTRD